MAAQNPLGPLDPSVRSNDVTIEIFFHIHKSHEGRIAIQLEERRATAPYAKSGSRVLYLDTVKALSTSRDQEALSHLLSIHLKTPRPPGDRDCLACNRIEIPLEKTLSTLQCLAKTDKLLLEGKKVIPLLASPTPILWEGEEGKAGFSVTPFFVFHNQKQPLATLSWWLFGKPTLWSDHSHLGFFSEEVSRKWIERFSKGTLLLQGRDRKEFVEEGYAIRLQTSAPPQSAVLSPELHLTDATGSFAILHTQEAAFEKELLETAFIAKQVGRSHYYCPGDQVYETLKLLLDVGWILLDHEGRRLKTQSALTLHAHEEPGGARVTAHCLFQEKALSLHELLPLHKARKRWIPLDATSSGLIDWNQIKKIIPILEEGEWLQESFHFPKETVPHLLPLLDLPQVQWDQSLFKAACALKETRGIEEAPPGASFQGTLLPYQQKGVDWIAFLHQWGLGGLLADEMGLGKTVQVLAFLSRLPKETSILIVAPASLLFQWRLEIDRFVPDLQNVTLTSYAKMRLDIETFAAQQWGVLILDESQMIKTATTQTAKAAGRIPSCFRLALSGTPMENRPEELFSQFSFLLPRLAEKSSFQHNFFPFLLRRTKKSVSLELPPKIDQTLWIEMTPEQETLYQTFLSHLRANLLPKLGSNATLHRMEILEAILRLRQLASDPRLFAVHQTHGAKMEQLCLDLEEALQEGRKVLIYSQFTSFLQLVAKECQSRQWPFLTLDGSTPLEERAQRVALFQQSKEGPSLFLLSLKAGGVGLNLTAADTIFLLDPWWNESVEEQAIARSHRIGQTQTLLIKRYLTPSSIEEKILTLKQKKETAKEALLDTEASWTSEDLVHLLI